MFGRRSGAFSTPLSGEGPDLRSWRLAGPLGEDDRRECLPDVECLPLLGVLVEGEIFEDEGNLFRGTPNFTSAA